MPKPFLPWIPFSETFLKQIIRSTNMHKGLRGSDTHKKKIRSKRNSNTSISGKMVQ